MKIGSGQGTKAASIAQKINADFVLHMAIILVMVVRTNAAQPEMTIRVTITNESITALFAEERWRRNKNEKSIFS